MKAHRTPTRLPSSADTGPFVLLPENHAAALAMRRVARSVKLQRPLNFALVYLHGLPGTGKTHLLHRLLREVIDSQPALTARVIAARDLARFLSTSIEHGKPHPEFHECDLLLIEDVQHTPITGAPVLTRLLDHRTARGKWSVVTSANGPATLAHLSRRLTSRLGAGLVVRIESYSSASRYRLARAFCKRRKLRVTREVLDWLARSPTGGARAILGDINLIAGLQLRSGLTLDLATVLAQIPDNTVASALDRLTERVADHFGISVNQIKKRGQHRYLVWPRQVSMYLARRVTDCSLPRIGAYFGGYDHTTVMHACRKVEERLKNDIGLPQELDELTALST